MRRAKEEEELRAATEAKRLADLQVHLMRCAVADTSSFCTSSAGRVAEKKPYAQFKRRVAATMDVAAMDAGMVPPSELEYRALFRSFSINREGGLVWAVPKLRKLSLIHI